MVQSPPANAGDTGSIPKSGRSLGEGHGNPLQYSCLRNPLDSRAWRATVHGVAKELDMTEQLNKTVQLAANSVGRGSLCLVNTFT